MVERTIVQKDENEEVNTAGVEASKNGASLAPALDLRSTYLIAGTAFGFPRLGHDTTRPHSTLFRQCPIPFPHRCVRLLAQSIATSGVHPRQHLQVRWVHF
jgi:hypothetical protein